MPTIRTLSLMAALAVCSVLALPAGAGAWFVSSSAAEPGPSHAGAFVVPTLDLPPEKVAAAQNSAESAPPASSIALNAALPRRAISGRVLAERSLPSPRLELERPFTDAYRQVSEFTYPYASRGDGRYVLHTGVDISNPLGTPVRAVANGQVVYAGNDSLQAFGPRPNFYGNLVITRLDGSPEREPVFVLFGHLERVLVTAGQQVEVGDVLGLVGMTGIAIGPHLHLEIRQEEDSYQSTRNPALWLASLPGQGTLAGRIVDETGAAVAGERLLIYRAERPNLVWRVVRSYLDSPLIHGDDAAGENFALPDMPAGDYRIVAGQAAASVQLPIRIEPGGLTLVEIRVEGGQ